MIDVKQIHKLARQTVETNKYLWANNGKANIGEHVQFTEIEGSWTGFEAILVGFGPSLERQVAMLRDVDRRRFKIVCVDVNFRYLIDNGITPDVMFNADALVPKERIFGKSLEYAKHTKDVMLCAFQGTNPEIVSNWQGKTCLYLTMDFVDFWKMMHKYTGCKNALASGGNVSTCAFTFITDVLEAKRLILMGQEHCWYRWGNRYAGHRDTDGRRPNKKHFRSKKKKLQRAKDYQGKPCYTDREYAFYVDWFDTMSGRTKKNVYDCSVGGLLGAGYIRKADIKEMLFDPFVETEYDVKAWIDMATRKLNPDRQEIVAVYSAPDDLQVKLKGKVVDWDVEVQHKQMIEWYEMNRLGNGITTKIMRDPRLGIVSRDVRYDIDADVGWYWDLDRIREYVRKAYNAA